MSERILYGADQEPIAVSPVYAVETTTTLGSIELDYANTRLRHFPGNDDMDHLEYTDADGKLHGIFFMHLPEDAPAELAALGYPATVDPLPSEADIAWYDQAVMKRMNVRVDDSEVPAKTETLADPNADTKTLLLMGATAMVLAFAAEKVLGGKAKK